ncbi:MAG: hypothetical protein PGN23_11655 [Sphingomonas adhaesiva]|uniref:hypothetical protein n=1 Tax=Sphingomonas adhaesiva TaxID=28212 RepID=UPI002FF91171
MSDPSLYLTTAVAALAGLAMLCYAALNGWRGWLQLKQQELRADAPAIAAAPSASARIEIADLKERIRKLEAIAAGVDL